MKRCYEIFCKRPKPRAPNNIQPDVHQGKTQPKAADSLVHYMGSLQTQQESAVLCETTKIMQYVCKKCKHHCSDLLLCRKPSRSYWVGNHLQNSNSCLQWCLFTFHFEHSAKITAAAAILQENPVTLCLLGNAARQALFVGLHVET